MGSLSLTTTPQEVRSILSQRVAGYQLLLSDYLTPLFHEELLDATKLQEEIIQHPDPTIFEQPRALRQLEQLDSLDAQLTEHWKDLNTSRVSREALLASIMGYQRFLATSMFMDYTGSSRREAFLAAWVSIMIDRLNKHCNTGEETGENIRLYRQMVTRPIKEMMLDQDHVEKRIRIAAAQPYPTGEIYRLIDECDWPNLATMLAGDRKLAVTLSGQKPLDPKFDNQHFCNIVLRNLNRIKDRYFEKLSSSSTYTTSKLARERSARKAAGLPLPPEPDRRSTGDRASAAAKGVYNSIISSLGLGTGTGAGPSVHSWSSDDSPRYSKDSTNRQISLKGKWE